MDTSREKPVTYKIKKHLWKSHNRSYQLYRHFFLIHRKALRMWRDSQTKFSAKFATWSTSSGEEEDFFSWRRQTQEFLCALWSCWLFSHPRAGPWLTLDLLSPHPCFFTSHEVEVRHTGSKIYPVQVALWCQQMGISSPARPCPNAALRWRCATLTSQFAGQYLASQSSSSYARIALNRKIWSSFTKYKPKEDSGGKYYSLELPQMWGQ